MYFSVYREKYVIYTTYVYRYIYYRDIYIVDILLG